MMASDVRFAFRFLRLIKLAIEHTIHITMSE